MNAEQAKGEALQLARKQIQGDFNVIKPDATEFIKEQLELQKSEHGTSTKKLKEGYYMAFGAKLLASEITRAIDWLRINEVSPKGFIISKYKKGYKYTQRENMIKEGIDAKQLLNKKNSIVIINAQELLLLRDNPFICPNCGDIHDDGLAGNLCVKCDQLEGDQQMGYFGEGDE